VDPNKDEATPEVTRIGKYEVVGVLGRGGMGVVYRAVDKLLGRDVAIKTLTQGVSDDPDIFARFYEEGRKTASLKHPHIVTIYDFGEENNVPYIVMERVEGEPLDQLLRIEAPLSMVERLKIVEEVCSALGYAHSNNVIHRDVKPANIFVQPDGRAKLLDFGIARLEKKNQDLSLTRAGHIIGTIPYMAPERLRDRDADGRSDIFSLGVVLYQLVAGRLPFAGEDYVLMQKITSEPHPRLSSLNIPFPAGLEAIVDRSLAKSADDRYQTAEEMAADLMDVILELRQEEVNELLPEARRLIDAEDWARARSLLQQILKVNGKHAEARELLSSIHQKLLLQKREDRIREYRLQAEDALARREYDQSLSLLKEALELDGSSPELLKLKDKAQQEKTKQNRIEEYLRQVDTARKNGDFKAAIASARKALRVDKANSKIILLCNMLTDEAEAAETRERTKAFVESVRRLINARNYGQALELLHKAEELDPLEPEIQILVKDAEAGLEQVRRRENVARLEEQLSLAHSLNELREAAKSIQESLASTPTDSGLFRLSALADRRIKEHEHRQLVEDTLQACRSLRPKEAIERVRSVRARLPADERLLALERMLNERLLEQTIEERRADYLARAKDELKRTAYSSAVNLLEACNAEQIADEEVRSLLEFARAEEAEQLHRMELKDSLDRAQTLIDGGFYREAVAFLSRTVKESDAPALKILLEQALAALSNEKRQIESALASAGKLVSDGKLEQALQLMKMLPEGILRSYDVQAAVRAIEDELYSTFYQELGLTYAALPSNVAVARKMMQSIDQTATERPDGTALQSAFRTRLRTAADRVLGDVLQECRNASGHEDKARAEKLIQSAAQITDLASPPLCSEWQKVLSRMTKRRIASRSRA